MNFTTSNEFVEDLSDFVKQIDKDKTAAILGSVPDLTLKKYNSIVEEYGDRLRSEIVRCTENGYNSFIIGNCNLFDILAGNMVLEVKKSIPEITLIFPKIFSLYAYTYYSFKYFPRQIMEIASNADLSFFVFEKYVRGIEKRQQEFIYSNCSHAITLFEPNSKSIKRISTLSGLSFENILEG